MGSYPWLPYGSLIETLDSFRIEGARALYNHLAGELIPAIENDIDNFVDSTAREAHMS